MEGMARRLSAVLGLVGLMTLAACNLQTTGSAADSGNGIDSQHMQLSTVNGYETIAKTDVTSLDVRLYASGEHNIFYDAHAASKLNSISLNSPEFLGSDEQDAETLGDMTITYRKGSSTESKLLYIKRGKHGHFVEDNGIQRAVRYKTVGPLDSNWLKG